MGDVPQRTKWLEEVRTQTFDFSPKIPAGETLVAVAAEVADGIELENTSFSETGLASVQVSGGELGGTYRVAVIATVSNGDILKMAYDLYITERN